MSNEQSVTRDIAAEPTRVWAVLTDLDSAAETLSGVKHVEILTEGPFRIGTRWRETRAAMGSDETFEMEVTELEALGFARIKATSEGARSVSTFKLEALHPGTRLTMTASGEPTDEAGTLKKLAAKIVAPVVGNRALRSTLETEIEEIARAAEAK